MNQTYDTTKFEKELKKLGLELSNQQIEQFLTYYETLVEWNQVMNLTSITEYDEVIEKHFIDSLSIVKTMDMSHVDNLIDVGTGAGFPGVPLAIAFPEIKVTLLDSLMKRVKFLNEVIEKCELNNAAAFQGRAEDFGRDVKYREQYDLVVSRAVANLSPLSEYCTPYAKTGGCFVAYKSSKTDEEIEGAKKALKILGCDINRIERFQLNNGDGRTLVVIDKLKNTPKKYPRKAGTPTKQPL